MAGKLGVSSIKQLMTTGKHGAIAVLQGIAKDGFQLKDLAAPLGSPTYMVSLQESAGRFRLAMAEGSELDFWDNIEIAQHAWVCWKDIATEGRLAIQKIKAGSIKKAS